MVNKVDHGTLVYVDAQSLEIIIRNLLNNAIKYSIIGDKIILDSLQTTKLTAITIRDFGIGMDSSTLDNIFINYESIEGTKGELGHGLGLKLSRDWAIANGGELKIISKLTKGATAILTFSR